MAREPRVGQPCCIQYVVQYRKAHNHYRVLVMLYKKAFLYFVIQEALSLLHDSCKYKKASELGTGGLFESELFRRFLRVFEVLRVLRG